MIALYVCSLSFCLFSSRHHPIFQACLSSSLINLTSVGIHPKIKCGHPNAEQWQLCLRTPQTLAGVILPLWLKCASHSFNKALLIADKPAAHYLPTTKELTKLETGAGEHSVTQSNQMGIFLSYCVSSTVFPLCVIVPPL